MSRRCKIDYIPVFQALKDLLPQNAVRGFVADFGSGVWQALKEVFPCMIINGFLSTPHRLCLDMSSFLVCSLPPPARLHFQVCPQADGLAFPSSRSHQTSFHAPERPTDRPTSASC
ncbi:uncharacterized protein [Mytilus edulis]|uniref:uncharacterized protein n=1 Tax=Mytilus edulis TaxID=6550 RepID=UPI0039EF888E